MGVVPQATVFMESGPVIGVVVKVFILHVSAGMAASDAAWSASGADHKIAVVLKIADVAGGSGADRSVVPAWIIRVFPGCFGTVALHAKAKRTI